MLYLTNAIIMAAMGSIWSKDGFPNIVIAICFSMMAAINAMWAAPTVMAWFSR